MKESDRLCYKFLFPKDSLVCDRIRIKDKLYLVSALVAPVAELKRNFLKFLIKVETWLACSLIHLEKKSSFLSITAIKSYYSIKEVSKNRICSWCGQIAQKLKRCSLSNVKSRQRRCQLCLSSQKSVVRKYANQMSGPTFRFHQTVKQLSADEITARLAARQDRRFKNRRCDGRVHLQYPLWYLQALNRMCQTDADGGNVLSLMTKKPNSRSSSVRRGRRDIRVEEKSQRAAVVPLLMVVSLSTQRNNSPFAVDQTVQWSCSAHFQ